MTRYDYLGLVGLALIVIGFGGGFEMYILTNLQAYDQMVQARGSADPSSLVTSIIRSHQYLLFGIPVGMVGVVLAGIAGRMMLVGRTDRPSSSDR